MRTLSLSARRLLLFKLPLTTKALALQRRLVMRGYITVSTCNETKRALLTRLL
jgi:hypothetical protein